MYLLAVHEWRHVFSGFLDSGCLRAFTFNYASRRELKIYTVSMREINDATSQKVCILKYDNDEYIQKGVV